MYSIIKAYSTAEKAIIKKASINFQVCKESLQTQYEKKWDFSFNLFLPTEANKSLSLSCFFQPNNLLTKLLNWGISGRLD